MPESPRPFPVPRRPAEGADRLESWKEIAAYLGREVRTVQGWEKNEGLPIHRHQHAKQGSVYAFKTELDAWREARKGSPGAELVADEPSPPAGGRRTLWLVVACVAIVILAGMLWWRNRTAKPSGQSLSSVVVLPLIVTVRSPFGKQKPSANSHSAPLAGSLVGQAVGPVGPCVVAFWHPALEHGPSPVAPGPSRPPTHVSKTCESE